MLRAPEEVVGALRDTLTPQGVLAVLPQPALPLPERPALVLVCDAVSDPGNLGTLLRVAFCPVDENAFESRGSRDYCHVKILISSACEKEANDAAGTGLGKIFRFDIEKDKADTCGCDDDQAPLTKCDPMAYKGARQTSNKNDTF